MSDNSPILVKLQNNVQTVKLNRPKKRNAITIAMYKDLTKILNDAAKNDNVIVTVLTGSGDYYSSGIDITSFLETMTDHSLLREAKLVIRTMVEAFIDFPKILIAIMNGPAIGIAATTLALCDAVYASEKAFFQTPFTTLGLSPEGCSTYTFPKMFGNSKATEIILFGKKVMPREALQHGFVSEVYSSDAMLEEIWNKINNIASLPPQSLVISKMLMKHSDKEYLKLINIKECDELEERWKSEECYTAVTNFISPTSKL